MRVITGSAKGIKLEELSGNDVRPTTDRIKEAIFSIVQFQIQGRKFLDLFGGSGQMGIEALSRGASQAIIVDSSKSSIDIIRRNLAKTNLSENARVVNMDSIVFLKGNNDTFDLAFLDPPYGKGLLQKALPMVERVMNTGGTIICECPVDEVLPEELEGFQIYKQYKYGKIMITAYQHKDVT